MFSLVNFRVAIVVALGAIGAIFLVPLAGFPRGTFPVMVVLGPLLVAQYLVWIRRRGAERTTAQYLAAEPTPAPSTDAARPASVTAN